jgi:predicted Zn-dependent protease
LSFRRSADPALPQASRPSTLRQRLFTVLLAFAMVLSVPGSGWAQVRLPSLGESASDDITPGTERRFGEQIMRQIRADPVYVDDPLLFDYLQSLWLPLVAEARERGDIAPDTDGTFAWEAFLLRDRSVNAFALPGGFVGVHLGMIAITASRDELASVLAHELSHLTQRHIVRGSVNSQRASLISLAALILGVLAASQGGNADIANATIAGGQAAATQQQLNFSRDMEREADRIGFGIFEGAGFAPAGMAGMFEKLQSASRLNDGNAFPYLRTHPLTIDRIAEARSRVLLSSGAEPGPPLHHALMQARARVLMDPTVTALRRHQDLSNSMAAGLPLKERVGVLYASALASSMLGDAAPAQAATADALKLVAGATPREPQAERQLLLLQAQLAGKRGDPRSALKMLDGLTLEPNGRAPMLMRAQAALDVQRQGSSPDPATLRTSLEALQTWVADYPKDASAWALLAAVAQASDLPLRALRAEAEAKMAMGDINAAIDRLRAGQQAARGAAGQDYIEASVIDARMRQLQSQRRQMVLDARGNRPTRKEGEPPPPQ